MKAGDSVLVALPPGAVPTGAEPAGTDPVGATPVGATAVELWKAALVVGYGAEETPGRMGPGFVPMGATGVSPTGAGWVSTGAGWVSTGEEVAEL